MYNEVEINKLLISKNKTISVAESCTGGLISNKLTNIPGSSKYFKMGLVAYRNEVKINILGVLKKTIENFGAVSSETAVEMASRIKNISNSDIGVGITGIAGPDGGSNYKPIGTVFISLAFDDKVIFKKYKYEGDRLEIKEKTSQSLFNMLFDILSKF